MYWFPDDDIPESKKLEKGFALGVLQAIDYFNRTGTFWYSDPTRFANMSLVESYSDGSQPEQMYKQLLHGEIRKGDEADDSKSKGLISYANISYKVFNPMPKAVSTLRQMFSERDFRIEIESLDREHINEKIKAKYKLYAQSKFGNPMRQKLGLASVENRFTPRDEQDLELIDKLGFFKLEIENALEKVIEHSFDLSNWRFIRQQFQKNLIDHRFRVAKVCCHPVTEVPYIKWLDPKKVIMQWNPDNLGEKPLFVGHYESVQIKTLIETLLNEGFSKEQIEEAIKPRVKLMYTNVDFNKMSGDTPIWYQYTIEVLCAEYISTNYNVRYTGKNVKGEYKNVEAPMDDDGNYKENKFEDGETYHIRRNDLYSGYLISGTDIYWGWKKCTHQLRDNDANVMYSYVWNYLRGESMTRRVQGILDDLQMSILKLRSAVAAASPKGYDIDLGEASSIIVGGKKLDIYDLMKIKRETGIKITKRIKNLDGSKEKLEPLNENDGGIGSQLNEWLTLIQMNISLLFDELGIPAVLTGQAIKSAEKAVGVVQQEVSGAVNSIFDEVEQEGIFKQKLAETILAYARVLIKDDPSVKEYYEDLLGERPIELIAAMEGYSIQSLGIKLRPKPTEARKAALLQQCIELSKSGRDGFMPMNQADLIYIENLLANDQLELATIYMSKAVERNTKEHEEAQKRIVDYTAQKQQESAMATKQMELQMAQQEAAVEMQLLERKIQLEGAMKERLQAQKIAGDIQTIQFEIAGERTTGKDIKNPLTS